MAELALDIQKNKKYNDIYLKKPILLLSGDSQPLLLKAMVEEEGIQNSCYQWLLL